MVRQLTKIRDQWALVLDDQMLSEAGIDANMRLEVLRYGHSIKIAPAPLESDVSKDPILENINRRYHHMFIRMAW